jgi:hypothetical protein
MLNNLLEISHHGVDVSNVITRNFLENNDPVPDEFKVLGMRTFHKTNIEGFETSSEIVINPYIIPSKFTSPRVRSTDASYKFLALQKWEGCVVQICDGEFEAQLKDITNGGADEFVKMSLDDIEDNERTLVAPGAVFYWSIGYETMKGTRRKISFVKFKRSVRLDAQDIEKLRSDAQQLKLAQRWT